MAKLSRKKGTTSQIFHIFIQDSSSTTGAGLTGLAYTGAGITPTVKYINAGGTLSASITLEDITTLGTYAAPTSNAHMRFKELNSASPSQGVYEIHVHNDWMNLTGGSFVIMMAGATNMAQFRMEIDLQADVNVTHVAGTAQTAGDIIADTNDLQTQIGTAGAGLTALGDTRIANLDATMSSRSTLTAASILTTALTESYAADGATATLSQLLYMIYSGLVEFSISGTTITCKKLDGTTTAMTFTLNDGTNPTSRTRAT